MPLVSREAVYEWMIRWLKNGDGDAHEQAAKMFTNHQLLVTPTGNVEEGPGSKKLYQLLLADFHARQQKRTIPELMTELRDLTIPTDGSTPQVKILEERHIANGQQEQIQFESDPGIWLDATLYLPSAAVREPAVLVVKGNESYGVKSTDSLAEQMAEQGRVVLEMEPRRSTLPNHEGQYTGDWMTDIQANLIGLNVPALRAHDILRSVDLLRARSWPAVLISVCRWRHHRFSERARRCVHSGIAALIREGQITRHVQGSAAGSVAAGPCWRTSKPLR